jgi:hypothetical protein
LLSIRATIDALVLAADLAEAALNIDTRTVDARLATRTDVPAFAAVMTIELRIDALPIADRAVVCALTLGLDA